jgi:hypothetical protein
VPAIPYVALVVNDHDPTDTPDDSIGISNTLVEGTNYLILAWGQHRGGGTSDTSNMALSVGPSGSRVVYARSRNNSTFNPLNLTSVANGANTPFAAAFTYEAGANEQMQGHHWTSDGTGESRMLAVALDTDVLTEHYHEETANSDTIVDTPTSGWEAVGDPLTETVAAGFYALIVTCESVDSGSAEAGNEHAIRVMHGATELGNPRVQQNASTTDDDIYGYLFARIVELTADEHTFTVEGNGTASGGNLGFRRVRLHLIPINQFEDSDVQQTLDAGETVSGISSTGVCATTIDPPAARDYLNIIQYQCQQANWSEGLGTIDDVPIGDGFGAGPVDSGVGTADDLTRVQAIELITGIDSSTEIGILLNKVAGGGGSNNLYAGGDCPRAANDSAPADISLILIRLATPDTGGTTLNADLAVELPVPEAAFAAVLVHHASLGVGLPLPTVGFAATVVHSADLAVELPVPTLALEATAVHHAELAQQLPVPEVAFEASVSGSISGDLAQQLPLPTVSFEATAVHHSDLAVTLPLPTVAFAATAVHHADLGVTLPLPIVALEASVFGDVTLADLSVTLPLPALSLAATAVRHVELAIALPVPTVAFAGAVAHGATLDVVLPLPVVSLGATAVHSSDLAIALPLPTVAFAGSVGEVPINPPFTVTHPDHGFTVTHPARNLRTVTHDV